MNNQQIENTSSNSGGRDSPSTATSTAKSSRRDSLTEKIVIPTQSQIQQKQQSIDQMLQQTTQVDVPKSAAFELPINNTNTNRRYALICTFCKSIYFSQFRYILVCTPLIPYFNC